MKPKLQNHSPVRFNLNVGDEGYHITHWLNKILVHCPICNEQAVNQSLHGARFNRRIVCVECGHNKTFKAEDYDIHKKAIDPFSDLGLWLVSPTSKGSIYAYNYEQLHALRSFVSASLRTRTQGPSGWQNNNYFSRSPLWVKAESNRTMILKAIDKLIENEQVHER